jgi:hypothetical protein
MAQIGPDPSMTPPHSVSRLFALLHRTNLSLERKTDKKTNCGIVQWLLSSTYLDCAALVTSAAQETPGLRPQLRGLLYTIRRLTGIDVDSYDSRLRSYHEPGLWTAPDPVFHLIDISKDGRRHHSPLSS